MKKHYFLLIIFNCLLFFVKGQNSRQWSTYFGGNDLDYGNNITTDLFGNVYITGNTSSAANISTPGTHQTSLGGGPNDAFLAKFNNSGVLQWSTYYGGYLDDNAYAVKTDAAGNVYIAGITSSNDSIATPGLHQTVNNGGLDAFVVKFNSSGVRIWGAYYGGSNADYLSGLAIDASGNVYICGSTQSISSISTPGSFQPNIDTTGSYPDAFVAKFSNNGNFLWGTYFGGNGTDLASDVATDFLGNVIISGFTYSTNNISTPGSFQSNFSGSQDAFVAKFNSAGNLAWSTYYGGPYNVTYGNGITCGPDGSIYLAGNTNDTSGIATPGSHQPNFGGFFDAYLVKFGMTGNRIWSTYYGGTANEEPTKVWLM